LSRAVSYNKLFHLLLFIEIFDVMIEGQQFEFLGFTLNPVIRMAIMRKVFMSEIFFHGNPRLSLSFLYCPTRMVCGADQHLIQQKKAVEKER
jgi:hypothetical protein